MGKIYLVSILEGNLKPIFKNAGLKREDNLKAGFITNAADVYTDKWFVENDRNELLKFTKNVVDIDLRQTQNEDLISLLNTLDLIYISGGNSFYLMEIMIKSGFASNIRPFLIQDKVLIGSSAGAVVLGKSLDHVKNLDDPKDAPDLNSTQALGLINFNVLPHFGEKQFRIDYLGAFESIYTAGGPVVAIENDQVVAVENGKIELLVNKYKVGERG